MAEHAEVFISGTTRDLGSYRREIKEALLILTLKIFPIEESNFELTYGPLLAMLRDLIGRCDVIHLAGFYYGAEPPQRPPGQRRRSYTQIEYDVARELKKRVMATSDRKPPLRIRTNEGYRRRVERKLNTTKARPSHDPVSSPIRSGNDFAGACLRKFRFAFSVAYRCRTMRWSPRICCISGPSRSKFTAEGHTIDACEPDHFYTDEVQLTRSASAT